MLVYVAGPVRALGREMAVQVRGPYVEEIAKRGWTAFDPPGAWHSRNGEMEGRLQAVNDAVLLSSDLLLVLWLKDVPSAGTEHEVDLALSRGMPLVTAGYGTEFVAWSAPIATRAVQAGSFFRMAFASSDSLRASFAVMHMDAWLRDRRLSAPLVQAVGVSAQLGDAVVPTRRDYHMREFDPDDDTVRAEDIR